MNLNTCVVERTAPKAEARFYAQNEEGKSVGIYLVVPGYHKDDIKISVTKETLVVSANKKKVPMDLYAQGFSNTFYRRSLDNEEEVLPITADNTTIVYENGILSINIEIPKSMHPTTLSIK